MKTSTTAWTLTALIVLTGIAWYVYANPMEGAYAPQDTSSYQVTTDTIGTTTMSTTTPASTASSSPTASTTKAAASTTIKTQ